MMIFFINYLNRVLYASNGIKSDESIQFGNQCLLLFILSMQHLLCHPSLYSYNMYYIYLESFAAFTKRGASHKLDLFLIHIRHVYTHTRAYYKHSMVALSQTHFIVIMFI